MLDYKDFYNNFISYKKQMKSLYWAGILLRVCVVFKTKNFWF